MDLSRMPRPSSGDLVAGISVALVALPQSLAYAEIAGMPPQHGLFASALPPIHGSSRKMKPFKIKAKSMGLHSTLSAGFQSGAAHHAYGAYNPSGTFGAYLSKGKSLRKK